MEYGYYQMVFNDSKKGGYFYQEAMKGLRTNVQFSAKNTNVIMLTSSFSNEGKSDIAYHLSYEMAKTRKKVLMIDADIRNSVYKSRYNVKVEYTDRQVPFEKIAAPDGLSEYLSGQVKDYRDFVFQVREPDQEETLDFYMILAGELVVNATELLSDPAFEALIKWAKEEFDYVFIDTPPLGSLIIDSAIIAHHCDGALIVVEKGRVSYHIVQKVQKQLKKSGCRVLGVVLNKVDLQGDRYYGTYGKYGKYGEYGKYGKYDETKSSDHQKKTQ